MQGFSATKLYQDDFEGCPAFKAQGMGLNVFELHRTHLNVVMVSPFSAGAVLESCLLIVIYFFGFAPLLMREASTLQHSSLTLALWPFRAQKHGK